MIKTTRRSFLKRLGALAALPFISKIEKNDGPSERDAKIAVSNPQVKDQFEIGDCGATVIYVGRKVIFDPINYGVIKIGGE